MISNAKYTKFGSIIAAIDGQEMTVPDDMENRHRIMLADWEAEGNMIEPYATPIFTPEELRAQMPRKSMVEFRVALRSVKVVQREGETELDGIYEADILEKISLIADRALQAEARDYFLYAGYIDRSNPWVDILGGMFGQSPKQIDTLWLA